MQLRRKFENRVWGRTESFSEFAYDKVIFVNRANIYKTEIVDYLLKEFPTKYCVTRRSYSVLNPRKIHLAL